jgi:hypothetical protein
LAWHFTDRERPDGLDDIQRRRHQPGQQAPPHHRDEWRQTGAGDPARIVGIGRAGMTTTTRERATGSSALDGRVRPLGPQQRRCRQVAHDEAIDIAAAGGLRRHRAGRRNATAGSDCRR